ncbi:hypothetical protein LCGC14_1831400 [marine sediment metagenome]|uniref:Uncharacterized protein n=1 Tax=marine sediment metagenome TaxID=412755 RepID=A0A0F9GG85_9ZZZZ
MALTVTWVEWHSTDTPGSTVGDATTNINLGDSDTVDIVPASFPVKAGEYSYFKQGKFNFSGSMTQIDNARVFKSSGVYKTEEVLEFSGGIAVSTPDATDQSWAAIPTSLPGSANVILPNLTTDVLLQTDQVSSPGYTSGSRSGLCGFQLETTSNTETGATNQKVVSITYDKQ